MKLSFINNIAFRNFFIYSFGTLILGLINFILIPIYSNYITPKEYGYLNLFQIINMVLVAIVDCGISMSFFSRYFYYENESKFDLITNSLFINVITFIPVLFTTLFFPDLLTLITGYKANIAFSFILIIIVFMTICSNLLLNVFRLLEKAILFLFLTVLRALLLGGGTLFLLIVFHKGFIAYFEAMAVASGITTVLSAVFVLSQYKNKRFRIRKDIIKDLLQLGLPLLLYGLLSIISISADKMILNTLLTTTSVGIYSLGNKLGSTIEAFLSTPLGQAFSPTGYRKHSQSEDIYCIFVKKMWFNYLALGTVFIIFVSVFLDLGFHYFINNRYWGSFYVVFIIMVGFFFSGAGGMLGGAVVIKRKTIYSPVVISVSSTLNIVLNLILIPRIDIYGSAIAFLVSSISLFIMNYSISQKLIPVKHDWKRIILLLSGFLFVFLFLLHMSSVEVIVITKFIIKLIVGMAYILFAFILVMRTIIGKKKGNEV